jgi:hypothetical protein
MNGLDAIEVFHPSINTIISLFGTINLSMIAGEGLHKRVLS